jgi:hypothetical protein
MGLDCVSSDGGATFHEENAGENTCSTTTTPVFHAIGIDDTIRSPLFDAVRQGVNQAGPVVEGLAVATPFVPLVAAAPAAVLSFLTPTTAAAGTAVVAAAESPEGQQAISNAASVLTPYGPAVQSSTPEAVEALNAVQNGATLYRAGITGVQNTTGAQFWSLTNPLTTSSYANAMGMPNIQAGSGSVPFVMAGQLAPGAQAITRLAPAVAGGGTGGTMEVVTAVNAVRLLWFVTH